MSKPPIVSLADFLAGRPRRDAALLQGEIRRRRLRGDDAPDRSRTADAWTQLLADAQARPVD